MLLVTEQAAGVIKELLTSGGLPAGAGLRLAQRDDHPALAMRMSRRPDAGDVVVREHDVAVFLGPVAARRTRSQTLDANRTPTSTAFYLRG